MITRIWHGYTNNENGPLYEALLRSEIFEGITGRNSPGFTSIELLKRKTEEGFEFITVMQFKSIDAVKLFAGDNYEEAVVPASARKLLSKFDAHSQHYEMVDKIIQNKT